MTQTSVHTAQRKSLEQLVFDNSFSRLPDAFYSYQETEPFETQYLVSFNPAAAELIDLHPQQAEREDFIDIMTARKALPGFKPLAACYSGHQFGHYVPRLGDGRAILLGEVLNEAGEKWDLQLKGGGATPYSRSGDGRAVLRSTIREYLCSEAMHALGIPTTRALCLIGSDDEVYREQIESGAMLIRMAPSHVRFGSFEYFYYTRQHDLLKVLADYVIEQHYPELREHKEPYLALLQQSIRNTAQMIAGWQAVGFAHGVMNSDNMSIHGITLDYGPFGFLDGFDQKFICNHSDHHGRYAFDQQPNIGGFNVSCLAQAMLPLLHDEPEAAAEIAMHALQDYQQHFVRRYHQLMRAKLGLHSSQEHDATLINHLLSLMQSEHTDYTIFFRRLSTDDPQLRDLFIDRDAFDRWQQSYQQRLEVETMDTQQRLAAMRSVNPKYILRNYLAEVAIRKAADDKDYSELNRLLECLQKPFEEQPENEAYAGFPPHWAGDIEVSCSS
jgi:uncharacterized protein YdiU (UPF0061 family)